MLHRALPVAFLGLLLGQGCSDGKPTALPAATPPLVIEVEPENPVGYPVLLSVKVTNTSDREIRYVNFGPGLYPDAGSLAILVTDSDGGNQVLHPTNGQGIQGSGPTLSIKVGESLRVPLAIPALPEGRYALVVVPIDGKGHVRYWPQGWASTTATVIVKGGVEASVAYERRLMDRVLEGDPFAEHVVGRYRIDAVQKALFPVLLTEDVRAARGAADALRHRPCPAHVAKALCDALAKHAACAARDREHDELLYYLMLSVEVGGIEAGVPPLERVARDASRPMNMRTSALNHLRNLRFESARSVLVSLLEDGEPEISSCSARALGWLKDDRALRRLLADARGLDPKSRPDALSTLVNFPSSDEALTTVRAASADPDKEVAERATRALEEMERKRGIGKPK